MEGSARESADDDVAASSSERGDRTVWIAAAKPGAQARAHEGVATPKGRTRVDSRTSATSGGARRDVHADARSPATQRRDSSRDALVSARFMTTSAWTPARAVVISRTDVDVNVVASIVIRLLLSRPRA